MVDRPLAWTRIFAEFFAITAAVYLGLLADNYRDYRTERASEGEYLQLFERDLNRDLQALATTRQGIADHADAAQLIHSALGGTEIPAGSLEDAFSVLLLTWTYQAQRPTFVSLRDGVGLHIIEDAKLRSALIDYYEVAQRLLQQDHMANYSRAQQRLRIGLGQHVRIAPPDRFKDLRSPADYVRNSGSIPPGYSQVITPLGEIQKDLSWE